MIRTFHCLTALLCLATAAPALAQTTTWEFSGSFASTEGDLPPEFAPGTGYRLRMTYDTAAPLLRTRMDNQGGKRYEYQPIGYLTFRLYVDGIADETFPLAAVNGGVIYLRDNYLSDTGNGTPIVITDGLTLSAVDGFDETDGEDLGVILRGSDTTVYDGGALPLAPDPRLMSMELRVMQYCRWEGGRFDANGQLKPCASGFIGNIDSVRLLTGPQLASMTLKTNVVAGCKSVSGTVTLDEPAPVGGRVVTLTDSLASASVLASLKVPEGATSRNFSVKTQAVAGDETGVVGATLDQLTLEDSLTVRRMGLSSVSFPSTTVIGGATLNGTIKLECPAGPGDIWVDVSSSMPGVAQPSAAMVMIPAGSNSAPLTVNTTPVATRKRPIISATANETLKTRTLTVNP